jgi:hypothetical protein
MSRVYSELQGSIGVDMDRESARQAVAEYEQLKSKR